MSPEIQFTHQHGQEFILREVETDLTEVGMPILITQEFYYFKENTEYITEKEWKPLRQLETYPYCPVCNQVIVR